MSAARHRGVLLSVVALPVLMGADVVATAGAGEWTWPGAFVVGCGIIADALRSGVRVTLTREGK